MSRKQFNVRLDDMTIETIKSIADKYNMSEGHLVSYAISSLSLSERRNLPQTQSIYFVTNENSDILYIGKSTDLRQRWYAHKISDIDEAAYISWIETDDHEILSKIERACIEHFAPPYNLHNNSSGRPPIGSARRIKRSISLTPEDEAELIKINPSISAAIRQIIKERKERQHNG